MESTETSVMEYIPRIPDWSELDPKGKKDWIEADRLRKRYSTDRVSPTVTFTRGQFSFVTTYF